MTPMRLTAADKISPLWLRIKAHYADRLDTLRLQNDGAMDQESRSTHIGRIAEVRGILDLENDPPYIPPPRPE